MILLRLISRLPLSVLYRLSDFIYLMLRFVIGYRKAVIMKNLRASFPEKPEQECRRIRNQFYRHLGDVIVESFKTLTISEKELNQRVHLVNPEVINQFYDKGQSVIAATAHQGNWEWMLVSCSSQLPFHVDAVYQQLKNPFFDQLMKDMRSRFGAEPVEKTTSFRTMVKHRNMTCITAMVADQMTRNLQHRYETKFLHQPTAFYSGPERIALKLQQPVIFVNMRRRCRGHYEVIFHLLDAPPFRKEVNYITEQYVRQVERAIQERPAEWLWSHNRWKQKRQPSKTTA